MAKFKDIEQLVGEDIESFFDNDKNVTYDFVQAASRTRLPKALISRHTYVAAVSDTRLVMWAKRGSIAKTLSDIACSIDLDELSIDDTWTSRSRKGCELFFPDGQRVIIESMDKDNKFVETLTENIVKAHSGPDNLDLDENEHAEMQDEVFTQPGVAQSDTSKLSEKISATNTQPSSKSDKTPVVTREVIIESLKRANEGSISALAIKQWAMKVRDCKIIDADEAMVSYILFSLSRIDPQDKEKAMDQISEFYERLTVTLV
ncbi:MAG: hypothetical protein U0R17_07235 [Acidimicrobiia bacterium]